MSAGKALEAPAFAVCMMLAAVALSGCSESPEAQTTSASHEAGSVPHPPPTFAPTFSAIYTELIAAHDCLLGLCHGEGASGGGLRLFPRDEAYDRLLAASTNRQCKDLGLAIVEPGAPAESLLWLKLQENPPCGLTMPPGTLVDPEHVEQVRRWIERGAPND